MSPRRLTLGHVVAASTSHQPLESESASGWSVQTRNAHNLILQCMSSDNHMALNAALAQQQLREDVGTGYDPLTLTERNADLFVESWGLAGGFRILVAAGRFRISLRDAQCRADPPVGSYWLNLLLMFSSYWRCAWEWGNLGSYGSHGISMGMGIRSAIGWEWDGNENECHATLGCVCMIMWDLGRKEPQLRISIRVVRLRLVKTVRILE